MLHELVNNLLNSDSISSYEKALEQLSDYFLQSGDLDNANELIKIATLHENKFSQRNTLDKMYEKKKKVQNFIKIYEHQKASRHSLIAIMLSNFPAFCKSLYLSEIHGKCSNEIKNHLSGFHIQNEYDLQKLMTAMFLAVFSDTRDEVVQDSGHHTVRKDVVIDSQSSIIELKHTRNEMSERQLSEEIASDMIHYSDKIIYFYIYDPASIIKNPENFINTYEKKTIDNKQVHLFIYQHDDL